MPDVFERCEACGAIAEYSQRVGTNSQDEEILYWCQYHVADISVNEVEQLEEFDGPVKVTFEWPNGAVEVRIPEGFAEAQEQAKEMLNAASDE